MGACPSKMRAWDFAEQKSLWNFSCLHGPPPVPGPAPPSVPTQLLHRGNGFCVDPAGGNGTKGEVLTLWNCSNSSETQLWQFSNGQLRWVPDLSKCLNGTTLADCDASSPHQKWQFYSIGATIFQPESD